MYGYDGSMNWLQWLALTGDPASLTLADQEKYHIFPTANSNQILSKLVTAVLEKKSTQFPTTV